MIAARYLILAENYSGIEMYNVEINYLNRGAQGIDIVALGIDFVAVRAWAQSVCRLE